MADVNTPEEAKKKKARSVVNNALRDGKISKPSACQVCGKKTSELDFDHKDYRHPLQGKWVCRHCHKLRTDKRTRTGNNKSAK